ncbi:hypothetical protein Pst134EA_017643 [Puccinia striiformis f. sp. tritici]|uniref:hypothetical protein n=1 Tax=Puccinia striiformis f. sp. tritici TaxID=168172 RepID=UPI002008186F|nr:hypothetical protein Pst134EA_017643 [Puccinia striiformis f. sp. tritici]KAH9451037.1 hypothetical protein Pst134EB_018542 [Puccinia striiformis f. sp. tritici]KAH9461334.1 hypothetical protein Pst134EA_017643 [Puccinia striiformis f. sp. tritici]
MHCTRYCFGGQDRPPRPVNPIGVYRVFTPRGYTLGPRASIFQGWHSLHLHDIHQGEKQEIASNSRKQN